MNGDDRHSHHHMNGYDRHSHHHMNGDDRHSHHHMNGDDRHSHHHINGDDRHSHHHMNGYDRHSHHHKNGDDRHSHHKSGDRVPSSDKHHSHHHGSDRNCSDHQHSQQHDGAAASGAAEPHTPAAVDPLTAAAEPHIPALELVHNTSDTLPCPMLYTRVGQRCLAFFTVARVPWSTAREFCNSIFGDLVTFTDIHQYIEILEYLQTSGVDVDLWVGGRDGKNGWEWMDGTPMPRGTPYWAIRSAEGTHSHIHPSTSYLQAPYSFPAWKYDQTGSCAAMMPKYFYYLSDVACRDLKSPVCALREGAQVVIARGSEDTYPGIFIPTQDDHTIVWEKAPPTKTAHTTTDMEGAPPNTTAHTNTATTQQVTSTPPASTSSPISKSEDDSDGSGIQPFPSKHRTFDDSSEEEEDDEEEEEEGKKEGEKGQKEGSGMMPDFLIDSETVHNIFMEI
nr:uncharacterized protein LOC128696120 [Cherax quadricarinatus]